MGQMTETQAWFIIIEVGIIAALTLLRALRL
jgi:hypothetical protein